MSLSVFLLPLLALGLAIFMYRGHPPHWLSRVWDDIWPILTASDPGRLPPFSLRRATQAFSVYTMLAEQETRYMRRTYNQLPRSHKHIGYEIGYPKKLNQRDEASVYNAQVTNAIASLAIREYRLDGINSSSTLGVDHTDLGRVREALKHFIRDWSEEGKTERRKIFQPVLDVMTAERLKEDITKSVLLPGSGLGRLAWEVSQLGFNATANELSPFMYLSLRFLLDAENTTVINQHWLRPYAHWFSHSRSYQDTHRAIPFPDVMPRLSANFHLLEDDFLHLRDYSSFDYIITLFFIDTSLNVIQTLEQIYSLLKPGGKWINLGPLLWTGGAQAALELSLDEVVALAKKIGFTFNVDTEVQKQKSIDCEYTADRTAMMSWVYHAEFWVAQKPSE